MHDLVIDNARIVDGTGAPARPGGGRRHRRTHHRRRHRRRRGGARAAGRARPGPGAGLHRPAYPLRRAGGLGPAPHLLVVARHHHGGDGQLRGGRGALPARGARGPHGRPRQRRGHPAGRHAARDRLGVGVLRRVHGRAEPPRRWASTWRRWCRSRRCATTCSARRPSTARRRRRRRRTLGRLFGEALDAGAFGLSTTILQNHVGDQGRPLACRLASADELRALCGEMRARGRGVIEAAITSLPDRVTDDEYATLKLLVEESRRPVTYLAVFARPGRPPGAHEEVVQRMAPLLGPRPRGAAGVLPAAPHPVHAQEPVHLRHHGHLGPGLQPHGGGAARAVRERGLPHPVEGGDGAAAHLPRPVARASPCATRQARRALALIGQERGRDRGGARPGPRRHHPGHRARRRARDAVRLPGDESGPGGRAAPGHRPALPHRAVRRRRPRGSALRRGLRHLSPRQVGARAAGPRPRGGRAAAHFRGGDLLRHSRSRA